MEIWQVPCSRAVPNRNKRRITAGCLPKTAFARTGHDNETRMDTYSMHTLPKAIQQSLAFLPTNVCAGVCSGQDWRLLAHNAALVQFFREIGASGRTGREPGRGITGESLFSLLYSADLSPAAGLIRTSKPDEFIAFTARERGYALSWRFLQPAPPDGKAGKKQENPAAPDAGEDLRFFILHEEPVSPESQGYDLLWQELQVIIDSIHDGIWVIDGDGTTVYVNKALNRIAGIEARDVIGKHVTVPMKEGKFTSCITLAALERREPVTMFDDYASGIRCLNTSTPIFDNNGKIWRVVASIRDMTELEVLQARLAEAERKAHTYKVRLDSMQHVNVPGFVANSKSMQNCLRELEKAAKAPSGVLLLGETGTGKTHAAAIIHQKSPRANAPFVTVNCAAIPSSLIESEMFGYEKGSFTGAGQSGKKGYFELAHKGTLLLDEIGELPLNMQAKLLHVLDNQSFHKVGGEKSVKVDTRIIAATNRPLEQLVESGEFRADLYYRLRVLSVAIPPLREHREDIPDMAMIFLDEACKRHGTAKTFSPRVLACFAAHTWPGNVRELRASVEFLAAMTEGSVIRVSDLPHYILASSPEVAAEVEPEADDTPKGLKQAVHALEYSMIRDALQKTKSTYKAAALLGVSQSTVVRKAQQLGIAVVGE